MQRSLSVLVVEDEVIVAAATEMILAEEGHSVLLASGEAEAVAAGQASRLDLAIVDLQLRDGTGSGVIEGLRAMSPRLPVIISTGYALDATERAVLDADSARTVLLRKPWSQASLLEAVASATKVCGMADHVTSG